LVLGDPLSSVSDKENNQARRVVIVALERTAVDLQCLEDEVKAELRRQSMKNKGGSQTGNAYEYNAYE
jgi:hypothetical protein